ncbi:hypothetical protein D7V21_06705 [Acinetobacter guerrae]|uniref:VanZ-like domain-containing protein n=1 Tax=Acinetobacter guerrae TaxID=1843371 RepID=A0A3A8EHN3_9GAMM|nr:hypothetical protein [Acinetobacter guerrae]RKG34437.1 hypothetical protein D7V21_06705 [Acinetobacter guerrae]
MYDSKFQEFKIYIVHFTHLARDALHIYAGLLAFLCVAFLDKRQLKSVWALVAVMFIAMGAELLDARDDFINYGYWRFDASLHDLLNTIFWPLVLWLIAKFKILK